MLTESGCRERQQKFWSRMDAEIEWVLLGDPRHVQYFCGFRPNPISFSADESALLLLLRDGSCILMADNFTRRTAVADVYVSEEVIDAWYNHQNSVSSRHRALLRALETVRPRLNRTAGMIERDAVPLHVIDLLPQAVEPDADSAESPGDIIRDLRRSKMPDELALLERCMDAGAAGHRAAFQAVQPGVSEIDVYQAVRTAAESAAGCPCVVYGDFRATSGQVFRAGGLPSSRRLQPGDLFLLDYSVIIAGYRSDITNTIAVSEPTADQTRQAQACLAAMQKAEDILAPGCRAADVFTAADGELQAHGFPGLSHHAGHGVGMEHPEPPILVPHSTDVLRAGDVVTLEPGLYIEGTGGMRFEHNYVITEEGCRRLSHHQTGLTEGAD